MTGFSHSGFDHKNARTKEQKELMEKIESDGVCSFCIEYFRTYHPKPIIKENNSWLLSTNISPYEGTTHHFIFVYKSSHKISPNDMTREESADLFELIGFVINEYKIKGGSFFMRFGEAGWNGSSVEHLHAHLIVGVKENDKTEGIKIKLGYK